MVTVRIKGYCKYQAGYPGGMVWSPSQLILECGCSKVQRLSMYDVEAPHVVCPRCRADHTILVGNIVSQTISDHVIYPEHSEYEDLFNKRPTKLIKTVVFASDLAKSLSRESRVPKYELKDALILGPLDLKYKVVKIAVDISNCWFVENVDLRYSEFRQTVNFSGCTFHEEFNSGDETEAYTIYQKDFICKESRFKQAARFNGIQVKGSAYFDESIFEFEGANKPLKKLLASEFAVDFTTASFGGVLVCRDVEFQGSVSLNTIKCNLHGFFTDGTRFQGPVNFRFASFGLNLRCHGAVFGGEVDFRGVKCTNLYCSDPELDTAPYKGAIFEGKVDFKELRCSNLGFFRGAKFNDASSEVDLRFTHFRGDLDIRHAQFAGRMRLVETHVEQRLRCEGAEFKKDTDFRGVRCTNLYCSDLESSDIPYGGTTFRGKVDFKGLKCDGLAFFRGATFNNEGSEVDLRFTHFGGDLDLRYAYFAGQVRLGESDVSQKLRLGGACFRDDVELYGMTIQIFELLEVSKAPIEVRKSDYPNDPPHIKVERSELNALANQYILKTLWNWVKVRVKDLLKRRSTYIERLSAKILFRFKRLAKDIFPFEEKRWDLTGTTFNRFHGGPEDRLEKALAKRLVKKQDPRRFSRDPYLQLAKHYTNIGEEDEARKTNYEGRKALRENAKDFRKDNEQGRVSWSRPQFWVDFWLKWLTGYGYKAKRALFPLPILFIIGTRTFWGDDKLVQKGTSTDYVSGTLWETLWHSCMFNLDLLIPVLTFPSTDRWAPAPNYMWGEIVQVVEVIAGWLFVPLAIAAWSGLIKTNR